MDKLIGLKIEFECPKCAAKHSTKSIATEINSLRAGIYAPEICGCGNKKNFIIVGLRQLELVEKEDEQ